MITFRILKPEVDVIGRRTEESGAPDYRTASSETDILSSLRKKVSHQRQLASLMADFRREKIVSTVFGVSHSRLDDN